MGVKTQNPYNVYNFYPTVPKKPVHGRLTFDDIINNNEAIANSPIIDNTMVDVPGSPQIEQVRIPGAVEQTPAPEQNVSDAGSVTPSVMTYEDYLTRYAKAPNTIEARSYEDWLVAGGMDGAAQRAYDESVRRSETEYERAKAQYGAKAEALGRAGLTGSGYGDYLTGAGFAAMQGAKVAAADTKALTEAQQRSDYANYLMGVEMANEQAKAQAEAENEAGYAAYLTNSGNVKALIDQQITAGQDDASIKAYIQQRYGNQFDEYLDGWITSAHTYMDPAMEAAKVEQEKAETEAANAAQAERDAEALEAYERYASENGGEYAKLMMKNMGYTEEEINKAVASIQELNAAAQNTMVNLNGLTVDQLPTADAIQNEVALGRMSQADGEALLETAREKRAGMLKKQLEALSDPNINPEKANEEAIKIFDTIDNLSEEDLTDEDRAELYGIRAQAYLNTSAESNEPVSDVLQAFDDLGLNEDNANDAARDGFLKGLADQMKVTDVKPGKVLGMAKGYGAGYAIGGPVGGNIGETIGMFTAPDYSLTITTGKKENGKESKETIGVRTKKADDKTSEKLGTGTDMEIKKYNGKLYIFDGKWKEVTRVTTASTGSKENARTMYEILLSKY